MPVSHTIKYAFCRWENRLSVEEWTPVNSPITVDGELIECDSFGRSFGHPYFGKVRKVAVEDVIDDFNRYYCFSTSENEILVYKEEGAIIRW